MPDAMTDLTIQLLGPLSVTDADGNDLTPRIKKSQALLAMLCTAKHGRRTRAWLQANLWSDRMPSQAAGSLRSRLYDVRTALGDYREIINSDRSTIQIDLSRVNLDLNSMTSFEWLNSVTSGLEFLEGMDIIDDEFNAWLMEQRQHWSKRAEMPHSTSGMPAPAPVPASMPASMPESMPASVPTSVPAPGPTPVSASAPVSLSAPLSVNAHVSAPEPEIIVPATAGCLPDWSLSLTVLPLENKTEDENNRFACHGLSEDLIQNLQRLRWLPVVGSAASNIYYDQSGRRAAAVAEGMGAHYFVSGSLTVQSRSRTGYFQLSEAATARVIWSEGYDLEPLLSGNGISPVFDEIVSAIERAVSQSMQRRVMESDNRDESFNDQIWRGRWHLARLTKQDAELAYRHFNNALKLKRHSSEALIQMAFWHLWRTWVNRDDETGLNAAESFARQAVELDPDDGRCYAVIGIAEAWRRHHDSAIGFLKQAVELNPNLAIAYHQLGSAMNHADRPQDAIDPIKQAIRYSPRDQLDFAFQTEMAVALTRIDDHEEAYVRASRALMMKPRYWYAHIVRLLIAHRLEDGERIGEAQRALDENGVRVHSDQIDWLPFRSDDWPSQLRLLTDD